MKKILTYILAFSFLGSCSDFLDVEPVEDISINEQLSTLSGVQQALNGAYRSTASILASERLNLYAEAVSGNATFGPSRSTSSSVRGRFSVPVNIEAAYHFQDDATDSNLGSFYEDAYEVINNANLILKNVDGISATTEEKNQIKAEALSMRAFLHFNLLRVYAQNYSYNGEKLGIIYRQEPATEETYFPARLTVEDAYSKVIEDLNNAIALFTENQALPYGSANSYFSKTAAQSLLARAYLYTEQWQNAADMATQVIDNSGVTLLTTANYVEQWEFASQPVSEAILEFSALYDDEGNVGTTIAAIYNIPTEGSSETSIIGANGLLNLYESTDIRGKNTMFIEEQMETYIESTDTMEEQPYYFTKKYQDNAGATEIRLSELYLIRAEANARLGNLSTALSDLNVTYTRAGNTALSISSQTDLLEEIFNERRRELCFERHLIFDYGRFHKDMDRSADCLSTTCTLNYPNTHYILPIPNDDILLNENLQQNEGY